MFLREASSWVIVSTVFFDAAWADRLPDGRGSDWGDRLPDGRGSEWGFFGFVAFVAMRIPYTACAATASIIRLNSASTLALKSDSIV
jgi:hypothetical protein